MGPLIPIALTAAALGGLLWWRKKHPQLSAAVKELAAKTTLQGPRGERVFRPELAESMVRMLAVMTYAPADGQDRTKVVVRANPSGAPLDRSQSAYGWAESLNKTQSILGILSLATSAPGDKFLRAVDPGNEKAASDAGYAVLLYAGTLQKGLAPPGSPPSGAIAQPVPMDDQTRVRSEFDMPAIGDAIWDLLQNGKNPDEMDNVAKEIAQDGALFSAGLLQRRAAQLRAALPPAQPSPPQVTPTIAPQVQPAQPAQPAEPPPIPGGGGVEIPMVVSTASDPLNLRDAPNGKPIGTMPRGSVFLVTKKDDSGQWAYGTSASGQRGWATVQYLKDAGGGTAPAQGPSPTPGAPPGPVPYIVATASDPLTLRSAPSGAAIGTLARGSTFLVDQTQAGWAHGQSASGQTGWASLQFLKPQSASSGYAPGVIPFDRSRHPAASRRTVG